MMRLPICALVLAAAAPVAVQAQYKIVGPDGSVTYTDRPSAGSGAKVTALSRRGPNNPLSSDADLPFDLRQVAGRYPVTLFTSPDCPPCDNGRQLLQQRGVPYVERTVTSEDDAAALERAVGGRSVPSLTVGTQGLRGYAPTDWAAYLDAAGYPRESKLPRGWQPPAPTPLTARATPAQRAAPVPPADSDTPTAADAGPNVPNVPSIKF
jgi:glutaredoxin